MIIIIAYSTVNNGTNGTNNNKQQQL